MENEISEKSVLVEVEMLSIDAAMRVWMNGVFTYMEGV
jgi:NADPH-dependent curcumin reductase CurA